ncbi:MAG: DMT family transporter [Bacteroidales bacterium]|jgi:transporter family protein|nr:DMT family transporter [Bacteroidales bacterium]
MQWVLLSLISALLLGFYDIFKKSTVVNNAIIPVLFYSTLVSGLLFAPFILTSYFYPDFYQSAFWSHFYVEPLTWRQHLLIMGKTALILVSWMFSYSAMKNLPITVVGPVNQLRPAISLILLFAIFREHLTWMQWTGVVLAMVSFWLMGRSGKKEGIHFKTNKWVYMLLASAVMVALSGVYDKFLLSGESISPSTIQAWYTVYDFIMMAVMFFLIWRPKRKDHPFEWRWGIVAMAVFVSIADVIYLSGLKQEAAVLVLIPLILYGVRLVVSFVYGALCFKERNIRSKIIPLLMVLAALVFMCI